jgi:endonuclease G
MCLRDTRRMDALGYDPTFLATVDVPVLDPPDTPDEPGTVAEPLEYAHFTVRMHPTRRLAWWVGWNIDGLRLFPSESISRSGERFRLDARIPADAQTGEVAYADNDLDRGHIARRSDLLWGDLVEAKQANSDSFHFTNITPQHQDFNQSGRGGTWGLLENAVLALDGLQDRRLTLFAGPVLAADDPPYRGVVQLPVEHWKVVVYRLDGQLQSNAFLLSQNLDDLGERATIDFLDDFDTYLVGLDLLEERTGLRFTGLAGAPVEERRTTTPVLVTDPLQIPW